ncbi:hypothetical protein ACFE04_030052 [Oxalis oulophora]
MLASKPNKLGNIIPLQKMASLFFSETTAEENIKYAEIIIRKWDIDSPSVNKVTSLFQDETKEAKDFLKCVKDLRRARKFLISQNSVSNNKLVLAENLIEIAMKRLEKELYKILSDGKCILDLESISSTRYSSDASTKCDDSGSEDEVDTSVSSSPISDLKSIADCMISSGYSKECVNIFTLMRKSTLEDNMNKIGIDRFKSSRIHKMKWESLEDIVKVWLRALTVSVKTNFNREKLLCEQVFSSASITTRESCFCDIIRDSAMTIFKFPEQVAEHKRSPKNTFRLMELYETISDLWPEIDLLLCHEITSDIKSQALSSLRKLANAIHIVVSEFESTINKDSSKTQVPGGGIHQLSQSAMNYISSLAAYAKTLSDVLTIHPSVSPKTHFEVPKSDDPSTKNASTHLAWLIQVLLCKIDTKGAFYKEVALSYLFLANNLHFILEKVLTSNLETLLGEKWVTRHARKVRVFASKYELVAWNKVLSSLPQKNSTDLSSPEAAKECLRSFNVAFEETYKKQMTWIVTDGLLRDEMKSSIAKKLVPRYTEFFDRYVGMFIEEDQDLVRFSPDDLANYLSDLFYGNAVL